MVNGSLLGWWLPRLPMSCHRPSPPTMGTAPEGETCSWRVVGRLVCPSSLRPLSTALPGHCAEDRCGGAAGRRKGHKNRLLLGDCSP